MRPVAALWAILREAPPIATVALLVLMCLVSLTEGIGILMLVPLLESLPHQSDPGTVSHNFARTLASGGLDLPLEMILGLFVTLVMLRSALVYAQQRVSSHYQSRAIDRLRLRAFAHLLNAEWRWLAERRASDHASMLLTQASRVGAGLNQALALIVSILTLSAYVAAAAILSWQAALAATACAAMALVASVGRRRRALSLGEDMTKASRAMHASLESGLASLRLTKILDGQRRRLTEFTRVTDGLRCQQVRFVASAAGLRAELQAGGAIVLAILIYAGATWWQVSFAALIALAVVFARLASVVTIMQQQYHHWLHAVPALEDVMSFMAQAAHVAEPAGSEDDLVAWPIIGSLALDNVSLTYPGRVRPALDNVSVNIARNTITAIIGPSGAGKSSLADLVMGLVVPDRGGVAVDGTVMTGVARRHWRHSVGYVEQDAFFFDDTIRSNLLWARPSAKEADIVAALKSASAEFVLALPDGLDTVAGDRGFRFSGGERQRLALARALLGRPSLLILDEAMRALDPINEEMVWAALEGLRGTCTIIVIGHRLPMIDHADQVIMLDHGRVVATGTWA